MTLRNVLPRMSVWFAVLLGLVWLGRGSAALAQYEYESKGSVELTGYGGAYFGGTIYTGNSGTLNRNVNVNDDWSYGGRLEFIASHVIGLEFGYGRSVADREVGAGDGFQKMPLGDLTENRYELNLNFYTNPGHAQGYFTLGGGATHYTASLSDGMGTSASASDTRFTGNLGLGLKFHTSERVALRLDGRWRYTDTNVGGQDYYCDIYGYCYSYDNSYYSSGEVTAGLSVKLK